MNTNPLALVLAIGAALCLGPVGCEKKPEKKAATDTHAGHDHGDHADDHHDHDHEISLGKLAASGYEVEALVAESVKAGAEAHVTVKVTGGADRVVAVRAWVGKADGSGSVKAKAETEEHGYHAHVEVPGTLGADDKLWIELETEKQATVAVAFDLK
jgi:ABC-type nickel/cobalt efflux system permease component RcnA